MLAKLDLKLTEFDPHWPVLANVCSMSAKVDHDILTKVYQHWSKLVECWSSSINMFFGPGRAPRQEGLASSQQCRAPSCNTHRTLPGHGGGGRTGINREQSTHKITTTANTNQEKGNPQTCSQEKSQLNVCELCRRTPSRHREANQITDESCWIYPWVSRSSIKYATSMLHKHDVREAR